MILLPFPWPSEDILHWATNPEKQPNLPWSLSFPTYDAGFHVTEYWIRYLWNSSKRNGKFDHMHLMYFKSNDTRSIQWMVAQLQKTIKLCINNKTDLGRWARFSSPQHLELIYYFTYFTTVVPSIICVFLSCGCPQDLLEMLY